MTSKTKQLLKTAFSNFAPPEKLTLAEWADRYAYLSSESSAEAGKWLTLPYQREIMEAITNPEIEQVVVMKSARVGYALSIDTPIATPQGWTTMEFLREGDKVFDEKGNPTKVKYVSPIFLKHECFQITFCDGATIVADAEHRWLVEADKSLEVLLGKRPSGRTGRPKPNEPVTLKGLISTKEMSRAYIDHRGRHALAVSLAEPIKTSEKKLPIPPYTLGVWLGDGHLVTPRITKHIYDCEIAEYIAAEGVKTTVVNTDKRCDKQRTIYLDIDERNRSKWTKVFRRLGLLKEKYIPEIYFRGSIKQRIALIQGIMDTDGTVRPDGYCELTITSKNIADGLCELLASLGVKYTRSNREPMRAGYLPQYRVRFRANKFNPFKLKRKAERVTPPLKPSEVGRRRIWKVERIDSVPVRCIQVESKSHLFLCGREMIPTHNTKILNHTIAYHIHQDPCSIMVVQPTTADAEGYSKEEIAPMLRDTKVLQGVVSDPKSKDGTNTILQKIYAGGILSMVGANSPRGFRRVSRRIVLFDETDGYPKSAGVEGDPIKLGIKRTEYYWNRKIVIGSTPTISEVSRIEQAFNETDQRRFFVPCPHCGHEQYLKWPQFKWHEGDPYSAWYECEKNKCAISHHEKRAMIEKGRFIPTANGNPKYAGFHIWAAYSFSPNATWGQLVEEFLEAKKDPETLKTFINTVLGEVWVEDYKSKIDAHELLDRCEFYKEWVVPAKAVMLTAGVDVQDDRLEISIYGWADGEESWIITHQIIYGDPARFEIWKQLDELLFKPIKHEAGGSLTIAATAIDSGGHHTSEVYRYTRERRARHIFAVKGQSQKGKPPLGKATKVDINFKNVAMKSGAEVYPMGSDTIKDTLWRRFRIKEGEGAIHFFIGLSPAFFDQLTSEKPVTRLVKGFPVREWTKRSHARNEAWDCLVMAYAALHYLYMRKNRRTIFNQYREILEKQPKIEAAKPEITENKEQIESNKPDLPDLPKPKKGPILVPRRKGFISSW